MNRKLWHLAVVFPPICFLSAQEQNPQAPQQTNREGFLAGGPGLIQLFIQLRVPRSLAFGDRGGGAELLVAHSLGLLPTSLDFHAR